jgi:hypothetical protein
MASVTVTLAAPAGYAGVREPECDAHHAQVHHDGIAVQPDTGSGAQSPDACRAMPGCGILMPALAVPTLTRLAVSLPVVTSAATPSRMSGLSAFGPPTPPPNS